MRVQIEIVLPEKWYSESAIRALPSLLNAAIQTGITMILINDLSDLNNLNKYVNIGILGQKNWYLFINLTLLL